MFHGGVTIRLGIGLVSRVEASHVNCLMALVEVVVSSTTIICGDKGTATTFDKLVLGQLVCKICHIVCGTLTVIWTINGILPVAFWLDYTLV